MPTLQQSCHDSNNNAFGINGATSNWRAQAFTTTGAYVLYSVKLKLSRPSTSPGTITVSIRATSSGLPTGSDLSSSTGTTNGNTLVDSATPSEEREFVLSTPISLSATTQYAIVVRTADDTAYWSRNTSGTYADGDCSSSENAGSSWTGVANADCWFENYSVDAPTITTEAVSARAATTGTGNGTITATGGANATRRGFAYKQGSSGDPTTADSVVYDDGDFGATAYTKAITGLTSGTIYQVRAYAVNSAGTAYGTTVSYTTASGPAGLKTFNGLAVGSVKTIKGLAIGSVKNWN